MVGIEYGKNLKVTPQSLKFVTCKLTHLKRGILILTFLGIYSKLPLSSGFLVALVVKNPPANSGDLGSSPGSERSPGQGNGNLLQYSYLVYPMDREDRQATVHGVTKELDTT